MVNPRFEHFKNFSSGPLTMEEKREVWLKISNMTREEFDAMMADHAKRNELVPQVGDEAPDFRIERLGSERERTGEFVKLSDLRGRPVALSFGSFT
jgi:hypothetical protein